MLLEVYSYISLWIETDDYIQVKNKTKKTSVFIEAIATVMHPIVDYIKISSIYFYISGDC
jgi:hypothetical protein